MVQRSRELSLYSSPYLGYDGVWKTYTLNGTETTVSQSNPWPYSKASGQDIGSEFTNTKSFFRVDTPSYLVGERRGYLNRIANQYDGPIFSRDPDSTLRSLISDTKWTSHLTLDGMGATAISRTIPTNPATDAMVFAAELASDGIPKAIGQSLWASRRKPLKGLAEENLNYQFGLAPTINDTMGLVDTVSNSEKILTQFARDSGRNIRRQYRFPTIHESTSTTSLFGKQPGGADQLTYFATNGQLTEVSTTSRDVWFSGCFTYYLNLGKSQSDRLERAAQQAKRLYGVRLTPDVLWNLAPWSWAADWATNIGDVLHNLSAFSTDGLVMRYGYIMEHSVHSLSSSLTGVYPQRYGTSGTTYSTISSPSMSETYRYERKIRRRATPFGFGLDPGTFTPRQWSILASLGITRGMR